MEVEKKVTTIKNPYIKKRRNAHRHNVPVKFKTADNWVLIKNYNPFLHDFSFKEGIPVHIFEFYISIHDQTFFSRTYAKKHFCAPDKVWKELTKSMMDKGHIYEYFKEGIKSGVQFHKIRDYTYKDYLKPMPARYALSETTRKKVRTFLNKLNTLDYRYESKHGYNKLKGIV